MSTLAHGPQIPAPSLSRPMSGWEMLQRAHPPGERRIAV
jgi:hypothetical protein